MYGLYQLCSNRSMVFAGKTGKTAPGPRRCTRSTASPGNPCRLISLFGKSQEGDVPGALDRHRQLPLMARAVSGNASWNDLSPFGEKTFQDLHLLIVDALLLLSAEPADALSLKIFLFHKTSVMI